MDIVPKTTKKMEYICVPISKRVQLKNNLKKTQSHSFSSLQQTMSSSLLPTCLALEPAAPASGKLEDAAPVFRAFLAEVITAGDAAALQFLLNCLSQLVQQPWKKLGVAVVLASSKGTGKAVLLEVLCRIFGEYSAQLTEPRQLMGPWALAHIQNKVLLVLKEGVWSGERKSCRGDTGNNVLNSLIADSRCIYERPAAEAVVGVNCWSVFISSSHETGPAAVDDNHRLYKLSVSSHRRGDSDYFWKLRAALHAGEDRQFLWYLLNREIPSGWQPLVA